MTRDEVLRALGKLSPADRDSIRWTLNQRAENDAATARVKDKLAAEEDRLREQQDDDGA